MMLRLCPALLCTLPLIAACSGGGDDFPRLLPTSQVLAAPDLPTHAHDAATSPPEEQISARAEALRARAEALRGPVIDATTRTRMRSATPSQDPA